MSSRVISKRKQGLDFLKFVCAFFVLCAHSQLPETISVLISPFIRMAVPVFLMITGYFYSTTKGKGREAVQILKIFKIFAGANILYFLYQLALRIGDVLGYLKSLCCIDVWWDFVLLNESPFAGHLWYLGALLYVLIIVYFIEKKWDRKVLYPLIPLLLLGDLVLGKYSLVIIGEVYPITYVRNFLFVGLPYFLIGDMIFRYQVKAKNALLVVGSVVFYITTLAERFLLEAFSLSAEREHYISSTFLSLSILLLALNITGENSKSWFNKIAVLGYKYSLVVYILHPIVISFVKKAVDLLGRFVPFIIPIYSCISPFIVLVVTIMITWGLNWMISKRKKL